MSVFDSTDMEEGDPSLTLGMTFQVTGIMGRSDGGSQAEIGPAYNSTLRTAIASPLSEKVSCHPERQRGISN